MRIAIITTALLLAAGSAFAAPAGGGAPPGDAARGKALFETIGCWSCHGLQGQGGREGPRLAGPVTRTYPALSAFVRTTTNTMPPYTEKVLPNQGLADIYAYLQSIPNPPDYKTIPILNGMQTTASAAR